MINKSKKILSEISAGEMLDKISILEIKIDKVKNIDSQKEIVKEYVSLKKTKNSHIKVTVEIEKLYKEIKKINLKLWSIEDKIRVYEKKKDFGNEFIELARSVYVTNDQRFKIKSEINKLAGSNIKEIKQYVDY